MHTRVAASLAAILVLGAIATGALAAGSAAPTSTNGQPVQVFATGLKTPTSFAFGDGVVFAGDGGNSSKLPNGGLYVLKGGKATELHTGLIFVGGLEFHAGTLYASAAGIGRTGPAFEIVAFKGWNGKAFASQKTLYIAPKGFQGFNGLAFGGDGRLYVGVDLGLLNNNDHNPAGSTPYVYDILSMTSRGADVKVFATGIRQPWQMAFPAGSDSPYVSDFGQDADAVNPPDFLLRVKAGQDYGFPTCNWTKATTAACRKDAKPVRFFAPHTDVGGVSIMGGTLYLGEFGYARPAAVLTLPVSGKGTPRVLVKDVPKGDNLIGLGTNDGYVYMGVVSGKTATVYRLKA